MLRWSLAESSGHFWWPEEFENVENLDFGNLKHLQNPGHLSLTAPSIFQVLCLHRIVYCRLQKTGVFVMVVKYPKYKVDVASFVALPCLFSTLCFITASVSLSICWLSRSTSLIVIVIACVEVECPANVFYSNDNVDLKVSFGWQVMIREMDEMVVGLRLKLAPLIKY